VLIERTQGCPAALVLAGIWLREVDEPSSAASRFLSDQSDQLFVADYLTTEVLVALDDDRRSFLERVAVLGQFTPDLCDPKTRTFADLLIECEESQALRTALVRCCAKRG
jgi:ATP/maltotriose-dependent transcriptional regulator MalT